MQSWTYRSASDARGLYHPLRVGITSPCQWYNNFHWKVNENWNFRCITWFYMFVKNTETVWSFWIFVPLCYSKLLFLFTGHQIALKNSADTRGLRGFICEQFVERLEKCHGDKRCCSIQSVWGRNEISVVLLNDVVLHFSWTVIRNYSLDFATCF